MPCRYGDESAHTASDVEGTKLMLSVLIAVRDFLVALALAWVGITLEAQNTHANPPACTGDACQVDVQHR